MCQINGLTWAWCTLFKATGPKTPDVQARLLQPPHDHQYVATIALATSGVSVSLMRVLS